MYVRPSVRDVTLDRYTEWCGVTKSDEIRLRLNLHHQLQPARVPARDKLRIFSAQGGGRVVLGARLRLNLRRQLQPAHVPARDKSRIFSARAGGRVVRRGRAGGRPAGRVSHQSGRRAPNPRIFSSGGHARAGSRRAAKGRGGPAIGGKREYLRNS